MGGMLSMWVVCRVCAVGVCGIFRVCGWYVESVNGVHSVWVVSEACQWCAEIASGMGKL